MPLKINKVPTREELHELFDYDPDGFLRWKHILFKNKIKSGDAAGHSYNSRETRRYVRINGVKYNNSRLVYQYHYGDLSEYELIDHADGNCSNDKIENLRKASSSQNQANKIGTGRSGVKGVYNRGKRFYSTIKINKKSKYLGMFSTAEEAHEAYKQAALGYFREFTKFDSKK